MRRLLFAPILFVLFAPSGHAAPPPPEETISGTVELNLNVPKNSFGVHLSDRFDPDATLARARDAERNGDFETAFHVFWAVCEFGRADSCLRAAMLADTRIVSSIPDEIVSHLYQKACAAGTLVACDLPRTPN